MSDYYILEGKTAKPATEWAKWYEHKKTNRTVNKTTISGVDISTVFLGLNHSWDGKTIEIFETMIFGGKHDQDCWRYATWDEAEKGHEAACELVRSDL